MQSFHLQYTKAPTKGELRLGITATPNEVFPYGNMIYFLLGNVIYCYRNMIYAPRGM